MMASAIRILKVVPLFIFIVVITCTGCASSKNNFISRKKAESTCDLTRMGENKYFYSSHYQRKLTRSLKDIARH
jgi:hypothetical protein